MSTSPAHTSETAQTTPKTAMSMSVTTHFSKKIPVFLGLCITVLVAAVFLGRGGLTRASDSRPADVAINTNSPSSVTITWTTGNTTQGQVLYTTDMDVFTKKTGGSINANYAPEESPTKDHSKTIDNLQMGTTYYFEIQVGDTVYDNAGVPWVFTTPAKDGTTVVPSPLPTQKITNPPISLSPAKRLSVTPIQHLVIPSSSTSVTSSCNYTDCTVIKSKFGQGCSTSDYLKCLKENATPTP